jgi:hypothetical protein
VPGASYAAVLAFSSTRPTSHVSVHVPSSHTHHAVCSRHCQQVIAARYGVLLEKAGISLRECSGGSTHRKHRHTHTAVASGNHPKPCVPHCTSLANSLSICLSIYLSVRLSAANSGGLFIINPEGVIQQITINDLVCHCCYWRVIPCTPPPPHTHSPDVPLV